jgi:hypothetical protein
MPHAGPLVLAAMVMVPALSGTQSPAPPNPAPATMALVTTYADGRTSYTLVSERSSRSWTMAYPRLASVPENAPRRALQIARARVGNDVRVTVSMLHSASMSDEDIVATVTISRGAQVMIEELRRFGVEPIGLSIVDTAPVMPYRPAAISIAPAVEITAVDLLTTPYPGYHVTVRNVAAQAVALFSVQSYRGTEKAISALRRGDRGRPAMAPGESHTFDIPLTAGMGAPDRAWAPLDVIEIDAILWEDGMQSGQHGAPLNFRIAADGGRRLQLEGALRVLHAAEKDGASATGLLSLLRRGFTALPESDVTRLAAARQSMHDTRLTILRDLQEEFERGSPRDAAEVRAWIHVTIEKYDAWLKRLAA